SEEKGFGVSSHLWDLVFGTQFDLKNEKENEVEVKKLMHERKVV
ncbi:MAG: fatty acid hydroxylase, partial [Bacteroidetes bacterium]|nr:fatty acid hydroxylase [Bacteroidota bacterium]